MLNLDPDMLGVGLVAGRDYIFDVRWAGSDASQRMRHRGRLTRNVHDSRIARRYLRRPQLFISSAELSMVRFFDKSFGTQMLKPMFRSYVINSFNRVKPEEQAYFRPPRDRVIGQSLEAVTADADSYFASMREALLLMRLALRQHTYLAETSRTTPSTSPGAPCNRIGAQAAAVPAPIGGE